MKGCLAGVIVIVLAIMGGCSAVFMAAGGADDPTRACVPAGGSPAPDANVVQVSAPPGDLPAAVGVYKGEQVVIAAQIIAAGEARGLDAKTITLAVMVGMGESSLTNVNHGDAARNDTIGVFQNGPERGPYDVRMDPAGAAGIFYDYLGRVKNYRELEPTIAAHKTQANADPYYYRPFWDPAVEMVATLSGVKDLTSVLAASGAPPCPPGDASGAVVAGDWAKPANARLNSPYGYRTIALYGYRKLHGGIDIAAGCDEPIYAAAAGTVTQAGPASGFGNLIVIDNGGGVQTYYAHMYPAGILTAVGQSVTPGTQIARVGSAGSSEACHLHFEVRIKGERTDPAAFLAERGVTF